MNTNLKWNRRPSLVSVNTAGDEATLNSSNPKGIKTGKEVSLTVASGFVLKKGTLLTASSSGNTLTPHTGFSETCKWVLDGDIVPTATKNTVLAVAGVTLTFTGTMTVANLMAVLKDAKPGDTGASLAAKGTSVSGSGTLAGWYPILDTANKTILWVNSTSFTNATDLTFTLVDTAASPVDLSSHVTATTTAFSTAPIVGILARDVNTVSAAVKCPVFKELKAFADVLALSVEPDEETVLIDAAKPTILCAGLFSFEQLQLRLLNTEFKIKQALSTLA